MVGDAPEPALDRVAEAVEGIAGTLESFPRRPQRAPEMPDLRDVASAFAVDPVIGRCNPLSPSVEVDLRDDIAVATVCFGIPYEGAPGFVHGGAIAAVFDQVLGLANLAGGHAGMTGTLVVRYLAPTPVGSPVRFEASAGARAGRRSFTRASATVGGDVTAEAEGIFVAPSLERAAEMFSGAAIAPESPSLPRTP